MDGDGGLTLERGAKLLLLVRNEVMIVDGIDRLTLERERGKTGPSGPKRGHDSGRYWQTHLRERGKTAPPGLKRGRDSGQC